MGQHPVANLIDPTQITVPGVKLEGVSINNIDLGFSFIIHYPSFRVQAVQERLRVDKEKARFEIAALFQPPVRREKKRANFKTFIEFVYPESFLY